MEKAKDKICVILTGGTICSVPGENGKNQSNAAKTGTRLTDDYEKNSASPFRDKVSFDIEFLKPDILSENMTVDAWNGIIKIFKKIKCNKYKGIIVLHGTDTLAYTSSFLSFALAGINIPVCMVSAQQRLGTEDKNGNWIRNNESNGYANFRASVELIMNNIKPNVYAVYRNEPLDSNAPIESGEFLVHYGSHLLQCANGSNNFHSRDEMLIPDTRNAKLEGASFESGACLYRSINRISNKVLMLMPYTNLDYRAVNLKGVKAIVHGTYHSESVCIGRPMQEFRTKPERNNYKLEEIAKKDRYYSILYLLKKCDEKNVPVFLTPCDIDSANYGTTANACIGGAIPIGSSVVTVEAVYAKAVLWCALRDENSSLESFLKQSINCEFDKTLNS